MCHGIQTRQKIEWFFTKYWDKFTRELRPMETLNSDFELILFYLRNKIMFIYIIKRYV